MSQYLIRTSILLWMIALSIVLTAPSSIARDQSIDEYKVGAGDVLNIQVWDNDDLNRTIEVSQDGSFSFPFIGKVNASNLSVFQIERLLIQKLSEGYLVAPQVSITVEEYNNQKVFLLGEVARPGSYTLKHRCHLLELISEAGGFTEKRSTTCIIVRPEAKGEKNQPKSIHNAEKSEIIRINLDELISGEVSFFILPGDSIYIGKSEKIYVTGEVMSPGKLKWEKGLTVREAVSLAGGGTPKASVNRILIIRNENGAETKIKPDLGDPVLPNDIIKVPASLF